MDYKESNIIQDSFSVITCSVESTEEEILLFFKEQISNFNLSTNVISIHNSFISVYNDLTRYGKISNVKLSSQAICIIMDYFLNFDNIPLNNLFTIAKIIRYNSSDLILLIFMKNEELLKKNDLLFIFFCKVIKLLPPLYDCELTVNIIDLILGYLQNIHEVYKRFTRSTSLVQLKAVLALCKNIILPLAICNKIFDCLINLMDFSLFQLNR